MVVESVRAQNNRVVGGHVHADAFYRDHGRHINSSGEPESHVRGVLIDLEIDGILCAHDVADKGAAVEVSFVDGAILTRVVDRVLGVGKHDRNIVQIYAVNLIEIEELIAKSDE